MGPWRPTQEICPTYPVELIGASGKPEAGQGPGKNAEAKAPHSAPTTDQQGGLGAFTQPEIDHHVPTQA